MKKNKNNKIIFAVVILCCIGIFLYIPNMHIDKDDITPSQKDKVYVESNEIIQFSNNLLNDSEKAVFSFYSFYLDSVYLKDSIEDGVYPELTNEGFYQLDRKGYLKFLDESGYFSSQFYENEKSKFDKCDDVLKSISTDEAESFAELQLPDNSCSFVFSNSWIGGQGENLDTVEVLNSSVDEVNGISVVNAVIGFKYDDGYIAYSFPKVILLRKTDGSKISKI